MKRIHSKHVHAAIEASIKTLQRLGPDVDELLRRREHEVSDGYPASSMGGSGQSGTISDPTQRTALQRKESDPTATAIDSIMAKLTEIDNLCQSIREKHRLVFDTEENERGRQTAGKFCDACGCFLSGGSEATRGFIGFCRKHYDRWRLYSSKANDRGDLASRDAFVKMIQAEIADEQNNRKKLVKA